MSDAKEKVEKADAPAAPKKKSKLVPILLTLVLVIVAGGGGAGAYWYYNHRPGQEAGAATPEPEKAPDPGMVEMEAFVVNLADPGGQRFLRVSMRLLTYDKEMAAEMKENAVKKTQLRSAILELLSMQTADPLITPEGKTALKKAIAERAAHAVEGMKVTDVLFVEFVVQ